jgi:uncharacterized protein (DUF1684 family)
MKCFKGMWNYSIWALLFLCCFSCSKAYIASIKQHRTSYKADFLKEERSPFYGREKALDSLRFYKPNPKYRVDAEFTPTPDAKPFEMATYSGEVQPYRKFGEVTFKLKGKIQQLAIYQSLRLVKIPGYKDYLFLPFKDLSNGESTYGGGRYINLKMGDIKEGKLTLDFNKNYNPYCAFADGYNCPIPPAENHLDIAIKAGEKSFAGEH